MPVQKDYSQIELKSKKLRIAVGLLIGLGVAILLRLTPAIDNYWINFITALIVSNTISICVISGLLIALHIVDLKRFKAMLEKEDEKNVH
ncbi:hypothetical protein [Faecalitalea cylindroides]|uniref:Uncharacterized protein n=1 Tax=Faecalitalea cylindroides TaxID=39483 RepID=A0AAW6FRC9_9FIRM|nr:hypothetical protein [Faecalitalea cylindroides]MDC0827985.1 hypothetical protein [Faecalitalea cylindroides]